MNQIIFPCQRNPIDFQPPLPFHLHIQQAQINCLKYASESTTPRSNLWPRCELNHLQDKGEAMVREAAKAGAQIILLQVL